MIFSVDKVRADFPVLSREVNGLPLAYLDSAASAQKPSQVIDAEAEFYRHGYAAVHRGIHTLSAQATEKMENVRKRASLFINARSAEELVFVRGTTEGINLVANSWGNSNVRAGDNIIITKICLRCRRKIARAKASLWPSSIRWRFQVSVTSFSCKRHLMRCAAIAARKRSTALIFRI